MPIKDVHDAYEQTLAPVFGQTQPMSPRKTCRPASAGDSHGVSNKFNHLLLTTGNKSEVAVGYCTLYGDMCGGLAVISDVPKTTV